VTGQDLVELIVERMLDRQGLGDITGGDRGGEGVDVVYSTDAGSKPASSRAGSMYLFVFRTSFPEGTRCSSCLR